MSAVPCDLALQRALRQISHARKDLAVFLKDDRRSAVAVILRVPGYTCKDLNAFIRDVPRGVEVLFIKRATSPRDRWSGHVALPGGRREFGQSDLETAMRETMEEVGLDLNKDGLYVGPLDQRQVRISWGSRVAMILCPFVFVLHNPDAEITPYNAEVAAAFWYPVEKLLDPSCQSFKNVPIGDRLRYSYLPRSIDRVVGSLIRLSCGDVMFPATLLHPNRLICPEHVVEPTSAPPYYLWGITYGVLSDLVELLHPGFVKQLRQPTFTAYDLRFILWLMSRSATERTRKQIAAKLTDKNTSINGKLDIANKMLANYHIFLQSAAFLGLSFRGLCAVLVVWKLLKH